MSIRGWTVAGMVALAGCTNGSTGPEADPASIRLSTTSVSFASLHETRDITATVLDASGSPLTGIAVSWSSSAIGVATVSSQGRVTAVGNGTAQVTASVEAIEASATVIVQQVPAALTLSPDVLRLASVGDAAMISAVVEDAGGSPIIGALVTFASADDAIATVDDNGLVTAEGDGVTYVTGQVAPGGGSLTEIVRVEAGTFLPPAYLVGGSVGVAYSDQVGPANGAGTFTYAVTGGALPAGLSLAPTTAAITGTPSAPGAHFFQVSASNGSATVSERFAITISTEPVGAFNLWVTYAGGALPPSNARTAVSAALARWEQIVTGDAGAAVTYPPTGLEPDDCQLVDASLLNGAFVEDVAILMALDAIDGAGKTLARGGPCGYGRTQLPAVITGQLLLDEVDAATASTSFLEDIVWHEMAHVLGVGTLWQDSTVGVGTPEPRYIGDHAETEWLALGGGSGGVPLEPDIGAHWDEAWFDTEMMTPWAESPVVSMPVSRVTVGALLDLGWSASLLAADPYALPPCAGSCTAPAPSDGPWGLAPVPDYVIERLIPLPRPGARR